MVTTDTSTREGIYVALTRGTSDARLYLVRNDTLDPTERSDVGLPILCDTRAPLKALTDHLQAPDPAMVIAATDPRCPCRPTTPHAQHRPAPPRSRR